MQLLLVHFLSYRINLLKRMTERLMKLFQQTNSPTIF